jgi:phage host-nuclease inhibitor protein Gam
MPKAPKCEARPPKLPPLKSDADAVAEIAKLGDVERRRAARKAEMEEEVQRAARGHALAIATLEAEAQARVENLRVYCEANRDRLTDGGARKTIEFATGAVSWRDRPPRVVIARGKLDAVIEYIEGKSALAKRFLRTSVELDKQALRNDPETAFTIPGVSIESGGEDFFVEPLAPELSEGVQP